ncbi:MAG: hypothetical protein QTN59_09210 [Candidatus Electrothrix communis]|nr:MAG: hypothetical protein QTN59_09210 [Candidatus Electrothrix communis]
MAKKRTAVLFTLIGILSFISVVLSETDGQSLSKDITRPTVTSQGSLLSYADSWQVKFSEPMAADTITIGNVNLYTVGASSGTLGHKILVNDVLKECEWSYETKTSVLTIQTAGHISECAACVRELEFTDKIKDVAGNKLISKTFEL